MNLRHAIAWAHGMASVQSLGGMLGPVTFLLPDGRQVSPLHVAPWFDDPSRKDQPPILQDLRAMFLPPPQVQHLLRNQL